MPNDILAIVEAGVQVAREMKNNPVKEKPVEEKILDKETSAKYADLNNEFREILKPGERYLTPAEAAARKKRIIDEMNKRNGQQ